MTTITTLPTTSINTSVCTNGAVGAERRRVWRAGAVAGVVAAVATTGVAALADVVGVSLEIGGEQIPLLGFAQLTMVGAIIGIAIAAILARRARQPRGTFVRTTTVLTALSLIPDIVHADADVATRVTLGVTHLVAAAIIVPALARRLAD